MKINPLTNGKGIHLRCELSGKEARAICEGCRVTFYCDEQHQSLDWEAIHSKVCGMIGILRKKVEVMGTSEERAHRDKMILETRRKVFEIAKTESLKNLNLGKHKIAIPAALLALRVGIELFGSQSLEIVMPYLYLGQGNIGLQRYEQAEEYLSLAKWVVVKAKACDYATQASLFRNFGLLYASKGNCKEAKENLAKDLYFTSLIYGPDHIGVSGCYWEMGNVFDKDGKQTFTAAFYDKVVAIWKEYVNSKGYATNYSPDDAKQAEAFQSLDQIQLFRQKYSTVLAANEIELVAAECAFSFGNMEKAVERGRKALTVYERELGREHRITLEAREFIKAATEAQHRKKVTDNEIEQWHRGFYRDCPSGELKKSDFIKIYKQYFPSGDASVFASYIFNLFDTDQNGIIDFNEFLKALSVTSRGAMEEKINWAFRLYDVDKDGFVSREDMLAVVGAIYQMIGSLGLDEDVNTADKRVKKIFHLMDQDNDDRLSFDEFKNGSLQDDMICNALALYEGLV